MMAHKQEIIKSWVLVIQVEYKTLKQNMGNGPKSCDENWSQILRNLKHFCEMRSDLVRLENPLRLLISTGIG